ncbi:class A beta-lactamase-related serine hydrolase [Rhizobium leguminosarum]|uniref:serine hydrolase domain-containing protein n=1 Tax=Rhizobium leguminosarum TaxID=384 RepID=UPI0010324DDF|nr:serine hydrolase domain-containing protein [Rhizobium leguminosarum]TAV47887.1 class A beta-lactamase-related serine hydrolase [Rhizobium leguminosarum]TAV57467.1 class A beta-lactamase-related serine hydrolase [Rhizobium leguminosarum]TAV68406.1 class A beta-lactamase-related serine hydrolase [Rhizobium leguminosarum]TAY66092.1 class A beta-lactamase-related serine hydrolase [Rhizobium leguminosarum]
MSLPLEMADADRNSSLAAAVDAAITSALDDKRLVGTVVFVARDGEIVHRRAAGLADRESSLAMREDTIFRLASITKPIVTIAAMRLVEQARIGLDDPVTRWLPDFRPRLPDGGEATIRIRHLLTHTSGLGYSFSEEEGGPYARAGVSDGLAEPGLPLAENLRRIASAPLRFVPGSDWQYSVAMDVLGGVIEAETGVPLGEAVAELVTKPLGLTDTAFSVRDRSRLAAAYMDASPEPALMGETALVMSLMGPIRFAPNRIFDPASYHSGGAGMAGTAGDILAILETIRRGGAPLLSSKTVGMMATDQASGRRQQHEPGSGFGFGWSVITNPAEAGVPFPTGTLKWGGVYGHSWFIDPLNGLTVVALTNTTLEGMWGKFTVDLREAIYAAL